MNNKTILVTGGAGFIGAHLVKKLIDLKYKVIVVDNFNDYYDPSLKRDRIYKFLKGYKFKIYKIDIQDYKKLAKVFEENKFNKIIHLAAQAGVRHSLKDPWRYIDWNITGMVNLLELSHKYKIKDFIYASSSSVYGGNTKVPFSESDRVDQPISLYAATKKADELIAYTYHHLYNINTVGLRFFTVYGPWGRPDMALFLFTKNVLKGVPIKVFNKGKMARDFTYIDDIIAGIIKVINKKFKYEIFNLGNSHPEKLMNFIRLIEKYTGKRARKKLIGMQLGDVKINWADLKKSTKLLGYRPKTKIDKGIKNFIEWYKEYYSVD